MLKANYNNIFLNLGNRLNYWQPNLHFKLFNYMTLKYKSSKKSRAEREQLVFSSSPYLNGFYYFWRNIVAAVKVACN